MVARGVDVVLAWKREIITASSLSGTGPLCMKCRAIVVVTSVGAEHHKVRWGQGSGWQSSRALVAGFVDTIIAERKECDKGEIILLWHGWLGCGQLKDHLVGEANFGGCG